MKLTHALVITVLLTGCAGKDMKPPRPETVAGLVNGAAQMSCGMFLPADKRPEARIVLAELVKLAGTDPGAAYAAMKSDTMLVIPAIGLIWSALHLVLDTWAPNAAQWTALAQSSVGAAASGCLKAIGTGEGVMADRRPAQFLPVHCAA